MAKFLFSNLPALGHINPTMPIASELQKRGHTVGYATGEDFREVFESEGMQFFPVGFPGLKNASTDNIKNIFRHTGMLSHYSFFKYLSEANLLSIDEFRLVVEKFKPDVIINDSFTYTGAQAAELSGIPWATFSSVPGLIPSSDAPPFTTWGLPPSSNTFVRAAYSVLRLGQDIFFRLFDPRYNRIRKSLGLSPVKGCAINSALSPNLIMIPSCEGFEYKRSDWPPQVHLIGPAPWGKLSSDNSADAWIDELPQDKQIVYVTIGTLQGYRSLDIFDIIIESLKDEPYHVVMSVGQATDLTRFSNAPDHFRFEPFVPHTKMLPRANAVIHHGGQGIAQDSIYHGLPSVVVPISQDLYEVARRCTSAGVSIGIPYPKLNPERLHTAVQQILHEPATRENTKKLQTVFLQTNAGETGASLLEKLLVTKAPVLRNTKQ